MSRAHRIALVAIGAAAVCAAAGWIALGAASASPTPPPASIGDAMNRTLPTSISELPLVDQAGRHVTLADFRGKVVFFAPFLTSCQEECPITTGALLSIKRTLAVDGLSTRVMIAEITVDPGRDTPSRLSAYARETGADLTYLTASSADVARLWHYFGIYYQKVPEGSPPGIDWQTHQPYTYDIDHSDGFVVLDAHLHERFIAAGMVRVASIPRSLRSLLDRQGVSNLSHPGGGSWSVPEGLDAIGWVLGQPVPVRPAG
ncbi:MAG: SCO family protein [Acidimicrobiales bacterium]